MREKTFDLSYISYFCLEMHLVIQAGIPGSEGLLMLAENETGTREKENIISMYDSMGLGETFHSAMTKTGAFPKYVTDMIEIGERLGNLDNVLLSLSEYYGRQLQITRSIKNAVIYPCVLLVMMLFVVIILITQVLPVFSDVFNQLGSSMTGVAAAILVFGQTIKNNWIVITVVAAIIIALLVFLVTNKKVRDTGFGQAFMKKLRVKMSYSRFASAMSMGLKSGLDIDESLDMTSKIITQRNISEKIKQCREKVAEGKSFTDALAYTNILTARDVRMLTVGFKTGSADFVMGEIADRTESDVQEDIEKLIGRVEPTLVIIMSVLVGLILLSVMLPLMGIMASLG